MTLRYKPGAWIGVRRGTVMVFLAPESDGFIIDEVWAMLRGGAGAVEVAAAIMDRPDPLLSIMPDFVIVSLGESAISEEVTTFSGVQTLVRGSTEVHIDGRSDYHSVGNWQGDRWQDFLTEDVLRLRIEFPRSNPIADSIAGPPPWLFGGGDAWLPLVEGVAPMGEILIEQPSADTHPTRRIPRMPAATIGSVADAPFATAQYDPGGYDALAATGDHAQVPRVAERTPITSDEFENPAVIVPTLLCDRGHPNPPDRSYCCVCGSALDSTVVPMPRPSLGIIRFTSGAIVELTNSVVIGRSPTPVRSGPPPILVPVPIPGHDISRNHIEVQLEEWHVLATDLNSVNGTMLFRSGEQPVAISPMVPVVLVDGDVLDLGDGVAIRYEDATKRGQHA